MFILYFCRNITIDRTFRPKIKIAKLKFGAHNIYTTDFSVVYVSTYDEHYVVSLTSILVKLWVPPNLPVTYDALVIVTELCAWYKWQEIVRGNLQTYNGHVSNTFV